MRKIKIGEDSLGSRCCRVFSDAGYAVYPQPRGTAGNAGCVTSAWSQSGPKATITILYYEGEQGDGA